MWHKQGQCKEDRRETKWHSRTGGRKTEETQNGPTRSVKRKVKNNSVTQQGHQKERERVTGWHRRVSGRERKKKEQEKHKRAQHGQMKEKKILILKVTVQEKAAAGMLLCLHCVRFLYLFLQSNFRYIHQYTHTVSDELYILFYVLLQFVCFFQS